MTAPDPAPHTSADVTAVAIHLLTERGYDSTSVDELAEALDVSRSTFFRRFGTKEDIVFADHTYLLDRLGVVLASGDGDAYDAVNNACLTVIRYHLSRPEATRERRALLRRNPSLRERELVMSHRYERIFRTHLSSHLNHIDAHSWMPSAYAAAAVAVHNDALRAWFADDRIDAVRHLRLQLAALADSFRAKAAPGASTVGRVVVTVYEPGAPIDSVLQSIRRAVED